MEALSNEKVLFEQILPFLEARKGKIIYKSLQSNLPFTSIRSLFSLLTKDRKAAIASAMAEHKNSDLLDILKLFSSEERLEIFSAMNLIVKPLILIFMI